MHKIQLHRIKVSVIFILFSALLTQCKSKKIVYEDASFQSIENYFAKKNWNFPINITDTTLLLKYYRDTSDLKIVPSQFSNDVEKFRIFFGNNQYLNSVIKKTLLDTVKVLSSGYCLSKPIIFIDTTDFGHFKCSEAFFSIFIIKV